MIERAQYALIGAVFGAVVGALAWWLFGIGTPSMSRQAFLQPDLFAWLKPTCAVGAVLGFVLKDKVGSVAGEAISLVFGAAMNSGQERSGPEVPRWLVVAVLVAVVLGAWFYVRQH